MPAHKYHHYVPRFYLSHWAVAGDVQCLRWVNDELESKPRTVKRICGVEFLYSRLHLANDPQFVEREFFGKRVDDPAALVMARLLQGRVPVDAAGRSDWARFLLSLRLRAPEMVRQLRVDAANALRQALDGLGAEEAGLVNPDGIADHGVHLLPAIIDNKEYGNRLINMSWWVSSFAASSVDLLTSDSPLIIDPILDDARCVIALPLAPRMAFFAAYTEEVARGIKAQNITKLAKDMNHMVVRQARTTVIASHDGHREFIRRRLNKPA
ncbi:MAG: DUF4238 domain-containing protein [Burkholderiales bacterium]|nr:DUF4238 domain-containing protein [Burkholderiales bacterium]